MKSSEILQELQRLKAQKSSTNSLTAKVNQFFAPTDKVVMGDETINDSNASARKGELLNTTVSDSARNYVTNVLGLYFNTEMAWFKIQLPELDLSKKDVMVLHERTKLLYKLIAKSNYYAVCPQLEWDVLINGHGHMGIDKDKDDFAVCYTEEPSNLYFKQSYHRKIICHFWERAVDLHALIDMFGHMPEVMRESGNLSANKRYTLVHVVTPNNEFYRQGLPEHKKERFKNKKGQIFRVLTRDLQAESRNYSEGIFELVCEVISKDRFIPSRNMPSRRDPYGDSKGKKALVKSRVLNKLYRDGLLTSGRLADPPKIGDPALKKASDEGTLGEGAFISRQNNAGSPDQKELEPLDIRGDLQGTIAFIQLVTESVHQQFPNTDNTYKTSRQSIQEIQQRLRDNEKLLGPLRSHYLKESVSRHLRRFYEIAKELKYFNDSKYTFEDETLERSTPRFNFDTILLQSHKLSKALKIVQFLGQSQAVFGLKPQEMLRVNGALALKMIADGNNVLDILNSDDVVDQAQNEMLNKSAEKDANESNALNSDALAKSGGALKDIMSAISDGVVGGEVPRV